MRSYFQISSTHEDCRIVQRFEAPLIGCGSLYHLRAFEVLGDKLVKHSLELRCIFANRPADLRARAQRQLRAKLNIGKITAQSLAFNRQRR